MMYPSNTCRVQRLTTSQMKWGLASKLITQINFLLPLVVVDLAAVPQQVVHAAAVEAAVGEAAAAAANLTDKKGKKKRLENLQSLYVYAYNVKYIFLILPSPD